MRSSPALLALISACRLGFDSTGDHAAVGDAGGDSGTPLVAPRSLAASDRGACAVLGDGTLWCWGANSGFAFGGTDRGTWLPTQIGDDADWMDVATATSHTCARKLDGSLWCWGSGGRIATGDTQDRGAPTQVGGAADWIAFDVGGFGGCGIRTGGALYCWGDPSNGAIGDGTNQARRAPVEIAAGSSFTAIATHDTHVCALDVDRRLWCWGNGFYGQLGNGSTQQINLTPLQIGSDEWAAISTGQYVTCGIKADGTLWEWGLYLGSTPLQIGVANDFTAVACGSDFNRSQHTCALRGDELWCVGRNKKGQLGTPGAIEIPRAAPLHVDPGHRFSTLALGESFTCATRDGVIACTGLGSTGQLGDGERTSLVPAFVESRWSAFDAGYHFVAAIASDGTLHGWGNNDNSGLGPLRFHNVNAPQRLDAQTSWAQVSTANLGALVRKTDGTIWRIGAQYSQQGSWQTYDTPTQIGTATWPSIGAGAWHDCAVQTGGSLWCWGSNSSGQLGTNTTGSPTPLQISGMSETYVFAAAGYETSCAIRSTGTLWCWGANYSGQIGDGTTTRRDAPVQAGTATTWAEVATSMTRTCGIQQDRSLWCWGTTIGDGSSATVTTPTRIGTAAWKQIAGSHYHTCGVQMDDTLWCWGSNGDGQLGDGTRIDRVVPTQIGAGTSWREVRVGGAFSCASTTDQRLACWGSNHEGQLGLGTAWSTTFQTVER